MQTAEEIYASTVRELPVEERLRLAALILNGVTQVDAHTEDTGASSSVGVISDDAFQAALARLNIRYSHALKRLAE